MNSLSGKCRGIVALSFIALIVIAARTARAGNDLQLSAPFVDGAVLQRDQKIPIWGQAAPGAKLRVRFEGTSAEAIADAQGNWRATLPAHAPGGPWTLEVSDGRIVRKIVDVLVGDVWLCSGQSNMEFTVSQAQDAAAEIARGDDPAIRHFKIPKSWALAPDAHLAGGAWVAATPRTVGEFSAVCWFFARALKAREGVPQGLINATWGGSRIEAWMNASTAQTNPAAVAMATRQQEEMEAARIAATRERLARWPTLHADAIDRDGHLTWAGETFDERDWATIRVPGYWEDQGYYGMDGIAWYRTHFTLSAQEAERGVTLGLAMIDDSDRVWVNGEKVGETIDHWNSVRAYRVPPRALHAGMNALAVRVEDLGGGGGIHGKKAQVYVQPEGGERRPLDAQWHFRPAAVSLAQMASYNELPTLLYNKMIHPLLGYALRGVLWYQGEANALPKQALSYRNQFADLIRAWRAEWRQPDLPFLWVQLPNFSSGEDVADESPWAELRESQSAALALPHTGQAVTIGLGDPEDIHPKDKQDVAQRLALIARRVVFGESVVSGGPTFRTLRIEGGRALLMFDADDGLAVRGGGTQLRGFEIAGEDHRYRPALARIEGERVVVSSDDVLHPRAVRYAWSDNPIDANLVDRGGLPAVPFRSTSAP
jgi:sialate O-acetylesterase